MKSNSQAGGLSYRPEIDGLRAIAVGAVLLFHAKLGLPGGFIGVDIFFVISGFLITSLILKDYESTAGFSILKFWERRVRRIMPALLLITLATVVGGWFVLLPSHYLDLGKSVLAQSVFGGNFYFWASSGYFAESAAAKPLLHTWSLAVEEQFYLFFPLLFLLWPKLKASSWRWIFGTLFVATLGLSVVQVREAPDAAFYLLPSRAWELLAGALLALQPCHLKLPKGLCEATGWSGLLAVGATFLWYDSSMPFPGLAAVVPVMGTVAVIWSCGIAGQRTLLGRMLEIRPLVFLGKISYSLYLWHWPILVYATYWQDNHILRWPVRVGLLMCSLLLAVISWRFVETPFRKRQLFPRQNDVFAFGALLPACCAIAGVILVSNQGIPPRFPAAIVRMDLPLSSEADAQESAIPLESTLKLAEQGMFHEMGPTNGPVQCLVWGDSHAMALTPAFRELAHDCSVRVEFATSPATCPVLNYTSFDPASLKDESPAWCQAVVDHVKAKGIPGVVLVANWPWYYCRGGSKNNFDFDAPTAQAFGRKLADTTIALQKAGAKVWIFRRVPVQSGDFRMRLAKAILGGRSTEIGVSKSQCMEISERQDQVFASAISNGAVMLDPLPVFFTNRETCLLESSGQWLYRDDNHVSPYGARLLKTLFLSVLEK